MSSTPTKVITGECRLSYVNVFTPRAAKPGQTEKYSVCLLIPKTDTKTVNEIRVAVKAAAEAGIGVLGGKIPAGLKNPLRDGDTERDSNEYKGHWFMNCNSKQMPGVIDEDRQPVLDPYQVYSGCYGRASVNFYAYNQEGNKGIGAGLQNLQKMAEGEPLSGRSRAEDDFTAITEDFLS